MSHFSWRSFPWWNTEFSLIVVGLISILCEILSHSYPHQNKRVMENNFPQLFDFDLKLHRTAEWLFLFLYSRTLWVIGISIFSIIRKQPMIYFWIYNDLLFEKVFMYWIKICSVLFLNQLVNRIIFPLIKIFILHFLFIFINNYLI